MPAVSPSAPAGTESTRTPTYRSNEMRGIGGATASTFRPFDVLEGTTLDLARAVSTQALHGDWSHYFDTIRVLRADDGDDGRTIVVKLKSGAAPAITVYVDASTGDLSRMESMLPIPGLDMMLPYEVRFEDYRDFNGIRLPGRDTLSNEAMGRSITEVRAVHPHVEVTDATFTLAEGDV